MWDVLSASGTLIVGWITTWSVLKIESQYYLLEWHNWSTSYFSHYMTSLSCHCFPGLEEKFEEEEEEEEDSHLCCCWRIGGKRIGRRDCSHWPALHLSKYFTDKRGRRWERESNRASWRGLYRIPLQSPSLLLLSPLLPSPLTTSSYWTYEEKATTNCLGWTIL